MDKNNKKYNDISNFYKTTAKSEIDKFDNRLFWFTGGALALSLGYFQATDTLHSSPFLVVGYLFLVSSICLMLFGLAKSSKISNELSIWYREKTNESSDYSDTEIVRNIESLDSSERNIMCMNYVALGLTIAGIVLIVVYMFINL